MLRRLAALGALLGLVLAAPGAPAQGAGLVLYTSQPNEDAQATVDAFEAAHPGVDVQWVRDGTTKLMAKLQAEFAGGNPQPDVLLIADSVTMEGLKRDGRLLPYAEADTSGFALSLLDKEKTYFSTKLITTGFMTNTAAEGAPRSWKDLAKPDFRGQVTMPSPLTSGAALVHVAALAQNPAFGWPYLEALARNGTTASGGNGAVMKSVAGGEKAYGIIVDYLPIREAAKGSPVTFTFPAEGVSAVTEPVAILKTAKNVEGARQFVDFLLSMEGQKLAARQGYLPAREGAEPPAGFPPVASIRLLPFDPGRALADEAANKRRFTELFGG
jgi:iron(III) transport system substrate-binding protein